MGNHLRRPELRVRPEPDRCSECRYRSLPGCEVLSLILLFTASAAPWSKPLWFPEGVEPPEQLNLAKDPLFTDGLFLVRSGQGALFMLWSSFGEEGYAMGVATSASGGISGPWVQQDEPLWARNGGHGMIFTDRDGDTRLVFHWPSDTPNERVKLVDVEVAADGIRLLR